MKIVGAAQPVPVRPARVERPKHSPDPDMVTLAKAPWSPRNSRRVVLECGALEFDWPVIKAIGAFGPMAERVYCEAHSEWHRIWKDATLKDVLRGRGIMPGQVDELNEPDRLF